MVLNGDGNLGINESDPQEKLHITNGNLLLSFGGGNELVFTAGNGGALISQKGNLPLSLATNNNARLKITELGAVLIGNDNVIADTQVNIEGGRLQVNRATLNGTANGEVQIGFNPGTNKNLLALNYEGAIGNTAGNYGLAGQVLTSGGPGAPFGWSDGSGGGGGTGTNPGPTPPTQPETGDLWYDINNDILFVWNGSSWQEVSGSGGGTSAGPNPPTNPVEGDLWWDSDNNLLYGWDEAADDWVLVGPQEITDGVTPSVTVGTTTTGDAGTNASVTDTGVAPDVVLNFTIPRGEDGNDGDAATVQVGTTSTGAPGTNASVTNSGDENNAVFDFVIPRGDKGEPGEDGTSVKLQGTVPTYADLANIVYAEAGDLWIVVDDTANGGTGQDYHAYVYDAVDDDWEFVGPIQGPDGPQGEAATITVGTTTTGQPGTQASVSNSGDENDAVFDFVIPRGDKGDPGTGITLLGSYDEIGAPDTAIPSPFPPGYTPADGDLWVDGNGDGWAWNGTSWDNVGQIQGPAGTIQIGTVTTVDPDTDADVRNVGTETNAILDFDIPQGEKGDPQKVFVNATAPANPVEGDLWYDTDEDELHIYVDGAWQELGGGSANIDVDPIQPTDPSIGDLWYDPDTNKLYVYNGTSWDEIDINTDLSNYVTIDTAQTITGQKSFTEIILGSAQSCEKQVTSGKGLTGGGKLTTDLQLTIDTGDGLAFDASDNLVVKAGNETIIVDAEGVKVDIDNIFNSDPYDAIVVTSFNGRKGDVDPADNDYSLGQLSDVDLTNSQSGYVLTQVGSEWHPAPMRLEGSLHFKGSIDANTATAPSGVLGDFWVNTGELGTVLNDPSWGILAGDPISDGDIIAKGDDVDGEPPVWVVLGSMGTEIGVVAVTAQNGVVDIGTATHPVLEADNTVVRTSGDFTLSGEITFNGDVNFNGEINGDISGNADGVNVSILAGEGLTGGGLLTEDRTLNVNHDSTLQIINDELGVAVSPGGGIEIDPYFGIVIDPDFIDEIIENNPNVITPGDGAIGLSVKTNGGLTVTGNNATANQEGDTAWEIECDNTVVRTVGNQQIAGEKTFNDLMTVSKSMNLSLQSGITLAATSFINFSALAELPD